jgi:hypothetical protein
MVNIKIFAKIFADFILDIRAINLHELLPGKDQISRSLLTPHKVSMQIRINRDNKFSLFCLQVNIPQRFKAPLS